MVDGCCPAAGDADRGGLASGMPGNGGRGDILDLVRFQHQSGDTPYVWAGIAVPSPGLWPQNDARQVLVPDGTPLRREVDFASAGTHYDPKNPE